MIHLRRLLCILSVVFALSSYPVASGTLPHLSKVELDALPKNGGKKYNRLIFEKSPYLLQHATNPVNWYPWSDEAFERARKENKPVFLSVGYSSCHWCHVMERESFSDEEVAAILNEKYISIKVDREERPDIDSIYMMATQLIQRGRGGWPNSVWLTPDKKPFFAGTYFPKEDRYSRPGFKSVLNQIFGIFSEGRKRVDESAEIIVTAIQDLMGTNRQKATKLDLNSRKEAVRQVEYSLEHLLSPATPGPKFPPHQKLLFLLQDFETSGKKDRLQNGLELLKTMAAGGIYDQIGGGFHRYSTDEKWFLPHFEKMLYDNAQLAQVYAHAFEITSDPLFEQVSRETIEFVLRDMCSKEGAFYSALDADSEGEEGIFYLWKVEEFQKHLGKKEGKNLAQFLNFQPVGNYRPEVGETVPGLNLPHLKNLVPKSETVNSQIEILRTIRSKRIWPLLDDKVLVSWNGLMIRALAFASKALKEPRYLKAAQRSANYILDKMRVKRRLYHNSRAGSNGVPGYLSDYANLAVALMQLYEVDKNKHWLKNAKSLVDDALHKFKDKENGGFFLTSSEHDVLLAREKAESDNVTPSAAGMMTDSLVRLYLASKEARYLQEARDALLYYSSDLLKSPLQSLSFMSALLAVVSKDETKPLLKSVSTPQAVERLSSLFELEKFPIKILASSVPKKSEILVKIHMEDGWHINSSEPYQEYLIATKVEALPSRGYTFGSVEYPDGIDLELDFSDEGLSVYDGTVELNIPYQAKTGTNKIPFFLHTQACSDSECKRPEKHSIEVVIQP